MLVEREVDAELRSWSASYLVLSTTSKLGPNYDQIWPLVGFDQQQLSTCCARRPLRDLRPNDDLILGLVACNQKSALDMKSSCNAQIWC